ncbi:MAG: hypothetical protein QME83_10910 [Thermodesulfobacteriota bacterium]|nr:hypothetical protein [Thermodesulfobacteriota bacterium]
MESAIISAIVAGIVSLIGFIINFKIARENRKTALQELKTQSKLKIGETIISDMSSFLSESESLRFSCLRLMKLLENVNDSDFRDTNWKLFFQFSEEFTSNQRTFFSYWFKIIRELRDQKPIILAGMMHDGNNICAAVTGYLQLIKYRYSEGESSFGIDVIENLRKIMKELIAYLEQLNSYIISERDGRLEELWGEKQPNKVLHRIADKSGSR